MVKEYQILLPMMITNYMIKLIMKQSISIMVEETARDHHFSKEIKQEIELDKKTL